MENAINSYETLFITDISAGEEAAKATIDKFTALISANAAEVIEVSEWGKKRLAYPINDKPEGAYTVVTFKAAPSFISELERLFNIDETVMRSLTIKLDFEPVAKSAAKIGEALKEAEAEENAEAEAENAESSFAADAGQVENADDAKAEDVAPASDPE